MSTRHRRRGMAIGAFGAITALALAACGSSEPPSDTNPEQAGSDAVSQCEDLAAAVADAPTSGAETFVFAASADPGTLNPFFASDGETFRVARQMFEGLVGTKPCTPDPAPLLATAWETTPDGKSTTFTLRDDVQFSDGTPFNAQAVCDNFEYWNTQPAGKAQTAAYYWQSLFLGFADTDPPSIYDSCQANGDTEVTVNLTEAFLGFVPAMSLPAFAMQSPTALARYADVPDGEDPTSSEYALRHPTGTGPYVLNQWDRGNEITLKANPNYWGEGPRTPNVTITTIEDPGARRDALTNDEIDGYDLVAPGDLATLEDAGFQLIDRPAFNILYLGMNQAQPPLDDIKVRQAIAYAIDKQAVVDQTLPPGSEVAKEFIPPSVNGYTDDVTDYPYDPDKAKQLLEEAGASDLTIDFNYPTDVSRPYMPSPADTYNIISTQLEDVGITVNPVADLWNPDYLEKIQNTPDHGIHLLGWTGDYNDTDNFLGVFFNQKNAEWGFDNPDLFSALSDARQIPSVEEQTTAYQDINKMVMDFLPGIPIAHPVPTLAFADTVQGFVPSPVQDEPWTTVVVTQ